MPEDGEAIGNCETWIATASLMESKLERKSLSKFPWWLLKDNGAPGPEPRPKEPKVWGITQTNLPLEVPPRGQVWALARAKENNRQTANPIRIRVGMASPYLAKMRWLPSCRNV